MYSGRTKVGISILCVLLVFLIIYGYNIIGLSEIVLTVVDVTIVGVMLVGAI